MSMELDLDAGKSPDRRYLFGSADSHVRQELKTATTTPSAWSSGILDTHDTLRLMILGLGRLPTG